MSDLDLPIQGKDCTVILTYDGAPIKVVELVEVTVEQMVSKTETKPLGTTTTQIDTQPVGWRIRMRINSARKDFSEFIDLITSGELLRVPGLAGITVKKRFRNLEQKSHTYLDVKRTAYQERHRREEASTEEVTFETGLNRIAA